MQKHKLSGPAVFMYSAMVLMTVISAVCFSLYYFEVYKTTVILWTGIVSFMVLYHFSLRIFMGNITKRFRIDYNHCWYRQRNFEKSLYKILAVRKWKRKVLTFEPEAFDIKNRTLEQIATAMSKAELDHWINEVISVTSIFFVFLWGCLPAFLISAVLAILFDAQFIVVQRYNRPVVLRLIEKQKLRAVVHNA
ncbi:MAG: hypothetical protein IJO48_04330 [Clostridia bacterium]|nr:hypothetical protein [Clostridia bacterium]